MNTTTIFQPKPIFSFEIFPPKRNTPLQSIDGTLSALSGLSPDFISVTCGAGGSGSQTTVGVASFIQQKYHLKSAAHLPCINLSKEEVLQTLQDFEQNGIKNILALRGDRSPEIPPKNDFHYASELISFIREHSSCRILAACYPEGHIEAASPQADLQHLKEKVAAGASHLLSQLFFDNDYFYDFLEHARAAGIEVPIEAGIMPVTNKKQIERMVTLCGAALPRKFQRILAHYEKSPEALRDAGIAFAIDQIVDLLANGVDGIHLYTMNNPAIASRISEAVSSLLGREKLSA